MENLDVIKPDILIETAKQKGQSFKMIKTNQIRNFFAGVLSIRNTVDSMDRFDFSKIETDLFLLKPKLAYAAGRQKNVEPFKIFMDEAIEAVSNSIEKEKAVKNFFNLIESVLAYHKFYGGKDI